MGFKKPTRNPDIYLSKEDIITILHLSKRDVNYLIEKRLLTPKSCDGKILFRLTELIQASFYYDNL